jgi:hypothetical protein
MTRSGRRSFDDKLNQNTTMNTHRWIQYFTANRGTFELPAMARDASMLSSSIKIPLRDSLAIFQLGESGGGTRLMRYVQRVVPEAKLSGYEDAVALFIAEEQFHARILEALVGHLGGRCLQKQWTNSVFRWVRHHFGVEFNIQVLLIAELIAEVYYGLIYRKCTDPTVRAICHRILADEMRHIAFHTEFLRERLAAMSGWRRSLWRAQFWCWHRLTSGVVAWDHRRCFRALGVAPGQVARMAFKTAARFLRRLSNPQILWQARHAAASVPG